VAELALILRRSHTIPIRTADGKLVYRLEKGRYKLGATLASLTSDDPEAP
jgi:hypothetical protein